MEVKLLGDLERRLSKLPQTLQKIVLEDLESAVANRLAVMERIKHAH